MFVPFLIVIINCETWLFSTIYGNKRMLLLEHSSHFGFTILIIPRYALLSYNAKLSHLFEYLIINQMTNLAFGGHF